MLRDIYVRRYRYLGSDNSDYQVLGDMFALSYLMALLSYAALIILVSCHVLPLFLVLKVLGISMVVGYILSSWSGFKDERERKYAIILGTGLVPGFIAGNILVFILIPIIKLLGRTIIVGGFMKLHLILSYIPKLFMARVVKNSRQ